MQNIFIELLPPWIETGLQPAFYDKESGTVLQQTARMYAKVNELVASYNQFTEDITDQQTNFEDSVNETVNEYIEKFTQLHDYVHDYFDNLDVQEEINNKLDAMAENGDLTPLIKAALNPDVAWTFDTVADMSASTNLVDGCYARTLGYHALNDGGGATYKIRTKTVSDVDDGGSIIELSDTLVAELILDSEVNVKQFGCYGDDTHDDTTALQNAINFVIANYNYELHVPRGIYVITSKVTINERCRIIGEGSRLPIIKGSGQNSYVEIKKGNDAFIYRLEIKNISFSADTSAKYALYCDHISESTFENVEFGYGTVCAFYAKYMEITSFYNCRFTNSTIGLHLDTRCVHNIFYTCNFWDNDTVIKPISVTEIVFNDTWFEKWGDHFMNIDDTTDITELLFKSCYFLQTNSAKTSANMITENRDIDYSMRFDSCSFTFPFTTNSSISLFHVGINSGAKKKYLDILNCRLLQKGNMKSWIDDANVLTPSSIHVSVSGSKWVSIPYLSDNKCKITGLMMLSYGQQALDKWIVLPDQTRDIVNYWPSAKEGTLYYNSSNGLICYKSSIDLTATTRIPVVPASNVIPQSTATDVATLKADLNALISKLYDSKIIKSS